MVHHGMFWDSDPKPVTGSLRRRLKFLLDHNLSLIGYHLPLDLHAEVGNNIQLVHKLGLLHPKPFGEYGGTTLGFMATPVTAVTLEELMARIHTLVNPAAVIYPFGPNHIHQIAVVSGGGQSTFREAVKKGADLFLTGEASEWVYHLAKEEGIHYVAAGHHATEILGVKSLGAVIGRTFGIDVEFVDIPNPI
jgi:dinuclear metal center YbgI/SA1388 family protein